MSVLGHRTRIDFARAASQTRHDQALIRIRSSWSKLDANDFLFDATVICAGILSCVMLPIALFSR